MTPSAPLHADAARRWHTFTLMEQLAHVGSEVERSIRAHERGNQSRFDGALARGLELFDLTAADDRWRGPKRREILRAREDFCALFWGDTDQPGAAASLSLYFLHFAVAARRASGRD